MVRITYTNVVRLIKVCIHRTVTGGPMCENRRGNSMGAKNAKQGVVHQLFG